jgi:hypothetical protein
MFKMPTGVAALVVAGLACLACTDGSSLKSRGGSGNGGQAGSSSSSIGGQTVPGSGGSGTGGQGDCICDFNPGGTTGSAGATGAGGTTGAGGGIGSGGGGSLGSGGADAGSNQAANDAAVAEVASDGISTDAGRFVCGDATCGPSQICLYPAYGCIMFRLPDSGTCPDGWVPDPTGGGCVQSPPAPSCVSPAPGEGSFDCSGQGADPTCATVNAPVPSGCSRICRGTCA